MAKIQFRSKVRKMHNTDGTVAYDYITVPVFKRSHCDMTAFRSHKKYGVLANSDMFHGVLARIKENLFPANLKLTMIPDGVSVDTTGFLAVVSIDV